MLQLVFYVPVESAEKVKKAIFEAGAGWSEKYTQCCFQNLGTGQFFSEKGANPTIGKVGELKKVEEYRIETIVAEDKIEAVIQALKASHPYEQVAYNIYQLYRWGEI